MDDSSRLNLKSQVYQQFARVGKAFANPKRLEMIDLLAQANHTVEALASKTSLSVASVSQHLQVLRDAQIVDVWREGTYAHYRLSDGRVFAIWAMMRDLAQDRLSEIDTLLHQYFEARDSLHTIDASELLQSLEDGTLTIIDARPRDEYDRGHIPNALSIPIDQLEAMLDALPDNCQVVAYCRASYCLLSDEVAVHLKQLGYDVRVYQEGFPEWQAAGYPIEQSTQAL